VRRNMSVELVRHFDLQQACAGLGLSDLVEPATAAGE
jgi:hypothetical protein